MEENYHKAYKEVLEILKYVPRESVEKIPKQMIETFKKKRDKNHFFEVDVTKSFEEQNLLEETKVIFAIIFRDYWATPYQREKIKAKENYEMQKLEEEKLKKYNPDDLFKRKIKEKNGESFQKDFKENIEEELKKTEQKENKLPVEYKEKFYTKIIKFFKKIFNI